MVTTKKVTNKATKKLVKKTSTAAPHKVKAQKKPMDRLLLRKLLAEDKPIWVQNNTAELAKTKRQKKGGDIALQFGSGYNVDRMIIPAGKDPVCISDYMDPESIRSSRDLFRAVQSGGLLLLDPEKAERYYQHNETRRAIVEKKLRDNLAGTLLPQAIMNSNEPPGSKPEPQKTAPVDPLVIDLCLKLKHKAITEDQATERLHELEGSLNEDELHYLQNNGKLASIKRWAKEQLSGKTLDEENEEDLDDTEEDADETEEGTEEGTEEDFEEEDEESEDVEEDFEEEVEEE